MPVAEAAWPCTAEASTQTAWTIPRRRVRCKRATAAATRWDSTNPSRPLVTTADSMATSAPRKTCDRPRTSPTSADLSGTSPLQRTTLMHHGPSSPPDGTLAPSRTGCTSSPRINYVLSAATDPVLQLVLPDVCRRLDDGAKLFAYLDDWYLWVKPQCLADALDLISASTRSVNLELQPSMIQVRASCPDPLPPELLEKVEPTLNCLGGHLHIQGDSEPSPVVPPWTRPSASSATLAELNAEGLHAQTVNDILTMYVGAGQHVLRTSLLPEDEAKRFDAEVIGFWLQLVQRDATSLPLPLATQAWRPGRWLS